MQSKSFDEISVQDITEVATVNRATFYDHYTDKFALLDAMVAGGFHELLHQRNLRYETNCPGALSAIILATCDFLSWAHSSQDCNRQNAFQPLMDAAMVAAIRRMLMEGLEKSGSRDPELVAAAASWAICGAVKQWVSKPDHPPAETVVPRLLELILPILEADSKAESPAGAAVRVHP